MRRPRPRDSPSSCCPSPTSPTILPKIISPTASPRISPQSCRASTTVSSSPATPPSPSRARASTPRRSARNLACATSSKARCSATPTGCASTRSSLTPESGAHLWADRFEDDVADLFKLQDEVVARLARTLQIELVNAEAQRSLHDRPRNPDAIDLTMRGFALLNQPIDESLVLRSPRLIRASVDTRPGQRRRSRGRGVGRRV